MLKKIWVLLIVCNISSNHLMGMRKPKPKIAPSLLAIIEKSSDTQFDDYLNRFKEALHSETYSSITTPQPFLFPTPTEKPTSTRKLHKTKKKNKKNDVWLYTYTPSIISHQTKLNLENLIRSSEKTMAPSDRVACMMHQGKVFFFIYRDTQKIYLFDRSFPTQKKWPYNNTQLRIIPANNGKVVCIGKLHDGNISYFPKPINALRRLR